MVYHCGVCGTAGTFHPDIAADIVSRARVELERLTAFEPIDADSDRRAEMILELGNLAYVLDGMAGRPAPAPDGTRETGGESYADHPIPSDPRRI